MEEQELAVCTLSMRGTWLPRGPQTGVRGSRDMGGGRGSGLTSGSLGGEDGRALVNTGSGRSW